jgi:hypothetical protein
LRMIFCENRRPLFGIMLQHKPQPFFAGGDGAWWSRGDDRIAPP